MLVSLQAPRVASLFGHHYGRRRLQTRRLLSALIDVDCNLWHADLQSLQHSTDHRPLALLQEDDLSGIAAVVSPSSTVDEAQRGLELLEQHSWPLPIRTTVGLHPYHVNDASIDDPERQVAKMRTLIDRYRQHVAAVGECGLDASPGFPPIQDQLPYFAAQVQLAEQLQLPLFVHERLAAKQTLEVLQDTSVPVIVHCFAGGAEDCREYMRRGYSLSISGYVCKDGSEPTQECLRQGLIPDDRLMLETDAPYMGFAGCRTRYVEKHADYVASLNAKKRKRLVNSIYPNVPSSLPLVADKVLQVVNEGRRERSEPLWTADELANATTANAKHFFGF